MKSYFGTIEEALIAHNSVPSSLSQSSEQEDEDREINKVGSYREQFTWAILFVFALATLAHRTATDAAIRDAREKQANAEGRLGAILNTEAGIAFVEREEALIELQRQKLTLALDQIEREERQRLCLWLLEVHDDESQTPAVRGLLTHGTLAADFTAQSFAAACRRAKACLLNENTRLALGEQWYNSSVDSLHLVADGRPPATLKGSRFLEPSNGSFLTGEIAKRIDALYVRTLALHDSARVELISYLRAHPEAIKDDALKSLIASYDAELLQNSLSDPELLHPTSAPNASSKKTEMILESIVKRLSDYVSEVFAKSNAPLLD